MFSYSRGVLVLLVASSLNTTTTSAVQPTIVSAQLNGSTLVITGSNFGTKANAAPFFYQDFTTHNGAPDADLLLGYANQRQFSSNSSGSITTVDTSLGRVAGKGALKLDIAAGAPDYFPHISINTSNTGRGSLTSQATDELYISYWVKLELTSGAPAQGTIQIKSARSGTGSTSTNYYTSYPLYVSSLYQKGDMSGYIGTYQEARDSSNATSTGEHFDTTNTSMWNSADWNFVEIWQKYNTPDIANGFFKYKINGIAINKDIASASFDSILVRKSGDNGKHFDYTMLVPGVDIPGHTTTSKYRLLFSEHYIDTTPQKVMIGNAATLAANKGGLLCPPSSWNDGSLAVAISSVPSGYKWIYVTNSTGETNTNGFPLGAAINPPSPPQNVRVSLQ